MASKRTPLQRFIGLISDDALRPQFIPHHTESFQPQRIVRRHLAPPNLDSCKLAPTLADPVFDSVTSQSKDILSSPPFRLDCCLGYPLRRRALLVGYAAHVACNDTREISFQMEHEKTYYLI